MSKTNKIDNLFKWIKDNNSKIHPNITYNENNKLILTENIGAEGITLFNINDKLCITGGEFIDLKPQNLKELSDDQLLNFNEPFFKLILNLINEKLKGKQSFYYQFIASLPTMEELVKILPIFYYTDRKEEWKKILPTVITKLDSLNNFYVNIYLIILKLKIFDINPKYFPGYTTKEEVLKTISLWAFLIVNNYAIDKKYLLPLYHLMHYSHETKNIIKRNNGINFEFNDIDKNELVINNGLLDNETLFALHGYINDNTKQYLEIKLSNKFATENEDINIVVNETFNKLFDRSIQKYYITFTIPSISLVQYLRIVSLNDRDLHFIEGDFEYFKKFISMDNESEVYKKLLKIVQIKYNQIKEYLDDSNPTDVKDVKILKQILKEQKNILKSMYFEIHKKWINIMESEIDENDIKNLFILK